MAFTAEALERLALPPKDCVHKVFVITSATSDALEKASRQIRKFANGWPRMRRRMLPEVGAHDYNDLRSKHRAANDPSEVCTREWNNHIHIKRKGGGSFVKVVNTCGMGSLRITYAYTHMCGGREGPTRASKTDRSV